VQQSKSGKGRSHSEDYVLAGDPAFDAFCHSVCVSGLSGGKAVDAFLHVVREGLCDWFKATLSPDYNADHADHFHIDMGAWPTCR
jgi:hypothetical protein